MYEITFVLLEIHIVFIEKVFDTVLGFLEVLTSSRNCEAELSCQRDK